MVAAAAFNGSAEGSKPNHKNNQQQKKAQLPNAAPSLPSKPAFPKKVSNNWADIAASKTPVASSDNANIQHQHSKSNFNNQINAQGAKTNNKSHSHNYYNQSQQQQQAQLQRQASKRGHNPSTDQHKKPRSSINDYNAAEVNNFLINRSRDLSQKSELHKQTGPISTKLKSRGFDKDIVSIELSKLLSKKL